MLYDNFTTLALYSIDKFILSGKIKSELSFKLMSSLTYNYITFFFDDNKLAFLRKKPNNDKNINNNNIIENKKEKKNFMLIRILLEEINIFYLAYI